MVMKNFRINRTVLTGLILVLLVALFSTTVMASTTKGIPDDVKKYIGHTYWSKTHYFGDGLEHYVYEVKTNKKIPLSKKEFFTKLKVTGYIKSESPNNFTAIINGKTCLVDESILISADPKDYSIFTSDPQKRFKWSKAIWDKLCTLNPFWGMTPDMLKMIRGNSTKINKITTKKGVMDQWVYTSDLGSEYYYFEKGKLTMWKI